MLQHSIVSVVVIFVQTFDCCLVMACAKMQCPRRLWLHHEAFCQLSLRHMQLHPANVNTNIMCQQLQRIEEAIYDSMHPFTKAGFQNSEVITTSCGSLHNCRLLGHSLPASDASLGSQASEAVTSNCQNSNAFGKFSPVSDTAIYSCCDPEACLEHTLYACDPLRKL